MTSTPGDVRRVATEPPAGLPELRPLPADIVELLAACGAPPLLVAHLRLVHDVAVDLIEWMRRTLPDVEFVPSAVAFGAATHDIGKARWPDELHAPGTHHESDGERLLLDAAIDPDRARFAVTHNAWDDPRVTLDDLLVAVADKVWKGRRDDDLESRLVDCIAERTGRASWDVFSLLDEELDALAHSADQRLAFQAMWSGRPN